MENELGYSISSVTSEGHNRFKHSLLAASAFSLGLLLTSPVMAGSVLTGDAFINPAGTNGTYLGIGNSGGTGSRLNC